LVAFLPLLKIDAREAGKAEKATRRALCLFNLAAMRAARRLAVRHWFAAGGPSEVLLDEAQLQRARELLGRQQ
jgi:hypothetical protein